MCKVIPQKTKITSFCYQTLIIGRICQRVGVMVKRKQTTGGKSLEYRPRMTATSEGHIHKHSVRTDIQSFDTFDEQCRRVVLHNSSVL
jgi:hypothetical protein